MTDMPVYSECVIGYRQWLVADWVLAPASIGAPWRPGVNHARCQRASGSAFVMYPTGGVHEVPPKDHKAPHADCECGLYALHTPAPERFSDEYVLGAVAAWGDLQVHHDGFRAEYAQIVALADQKVKDAPDLKAIAEFYGVPLVPLDMLVLEAGRHGQELPESIRPEKATIPFGGYAAIGNAFLPAGSYWYAASSAVINAAATLRERDALADALDDLHRYSVNDADGYAGSPCEAKVRAALEAIGRTVV